MRQSVRNPAVTVIAPRLAADIVAMVREGAGVRLDYSPASLVVADRLIGEIRQEGPPAGAVTRALLGFGAYTGEVLVRGVDAVWVPFEDEDFTRYGQPFGIRTPDGRVWNPLARALERYDRGPEHSLRAFYLQAAEDPARV
ncbi:hypothetical protein [Actinacidiphila acididurans]|uniref:Uncharacterized protein n=1 Tax=Actinacidiphila acididurans TaxID=2784346 RepID=A0ABS2U091_9ACTN|nr:hypothetical protein [Actinacidiphila acididurans]MBM9509004.1 hypothetical protein [Actinacidiphila acididurans]